MSADNLRRRGSMLLLLLFVLLALSFSFLCSILESVLLSISPAHISLLEQQQHPLAERLRALKHDIDRPLAAILSLNTIANTVGATGAGAQAARLFGSAWLGLFTAGFTFLVLTCAEIIPKTLGAVHWKRLTPLVVRVLQPLMQVMLPLVKLAEWLTDLLTPDSEDPPVSRDEIAALAEEGTRAGVVAEDESRIVRNLMRLSVLGAEDVMTPVEHIVSLPAGAAIGDALDGLTEPRFSRIPLRRAGSDGPAFTGYVLMDDVLELAARDRHDSPVDSVSRELLTVSPSLPVPEVLDRMVERREHLALVAAEDGTAAGLVTMEDIIETLLGLDIMDEADEAGMHALARAQWEERARRRGRAREAHSGTLGLTGGHVPPGSRT